MTETIPAKGHIWNEEYTVDKEATYTEEGSESIHCSVCGEIKPGTSRPIAKLPKPVSMLTVTGIIDKTYTGSALTQAIVIKDGETTLNNVTDYTVSYSNNINAGTASVLITGIGSYTGVVEKDFVIKPKEITPAVELSPESFIFNGKEQKPEVTVKDGGTQLDENDYDIQWPSALIAAGTYNVKVDLKGNYSGSNTVTFTIKPVGWYQENGEWYYNKNDGTKLTNGWAKDSIGWCWMDAYGKITKNKWIKDGNEWYFLKANGYMAANEWTKDSTGWCWMDASGKITKNKWIQSGGQWYFLKANGYMAANEWAKDSGGWYWMDGSGKITKNKWIQSGGQWYYLKANGYMSANEWARDSGGWYWMNGSGKITRSQWIQTGGKWYYLGADGYMVTGTRKINGKTYTFNSSGVWIK